METPRQDEDFAQLITRIMDTYGITSQSELARRIDVSPSTVNSWLSAKRGTGRGPKPEVLQRLIETFPRINKGEIEAAAGRRVPGPLTPNKEERLLAYFAELTEEQQRAKLLEMRALVEDNRSPSS